jgi:branched-chain amino acid transport system permease protein
MYFDLLITGLSVGALYGLIAFSISIIYAGLDIIHFAQGEIFAMGAFFGLMFYKTFKLPFIISCLLGVVCTVIVSVAIQKVLYNPILKMKGNLR